MGQPWNLAAIHCWRIHWRDIILRSQFLRQINMGKNFSVSWLPFFGKRRSSSVKGIGAGRASLEWIDVDWWVIICIGNALEWEIMHDFNQTSKPWFNWQTWSQLWSTSKILICVFIIIFTPGCKKCEYDHISAPCGFPRADVYSVLCLSTRKKKSIALYESPSIFVSFFLIFHFYQDVCEVCVELQT